MTLLELLPYCHSPKKLQPLCRQQGIREEAIQDEEIAICMENEKSLASPIRLFDATVTEDRLRFHHEGVDYVDFLTLTLVLDFLRELESEDLTELKKAQRLLHYSLSAA